MHERERDTVEDQIKTAAQPRRMIPARIGRDAQRYGILIALALLCIVLSIVSENFLTSRNIINVLRQTSINGILAIGMTFVILTRGIDLSVGSVVALVGVVSASFATTSAAGFIPGAPYMPLIPIAVGLITGTAMGALSGIAVARFAVPAFVATLGMLSAARGLTLIYSGGRPVPALTDGYRGGRDRRHQPGGRRGPGHRHRHRRAADRGDEQRPRSAWGRILLPAGDQGGADRGRRHAGPVPQDRRLRSGACRDMVSPREETR